MSTRWLCALVLALSAAGCANMGDRNAPIPTLTLQADELASDVLVVVLPGRWDDVAVLEQSGIAQAIQAARPEADVLLAGATLAYYTDGGLAERLHREIVAPARARGYREVWMAGASMGGLGVLLYEQDHPGELDGLVLLAPFMGGRGILREIERAGGIADWDPGPVPAQRDRRNFDRELWRHLQGWLDDPEAAARVWLAYGEEDRLRRAVPVIAPLLPPAHILERPGGHTWSVWVPAAREVFEQASRDDGLAVGAP